MLRKELEYETSIESIFYPKDYPNSEPQDSRKNKKNTKYTLQIKKKKGINYTRIQPKKYSQAKFPLN